MLLAGYMDRVSKGNLGRHQLYSLCIKASVSKCYEFNLSIEHLAKSESAFFAMSTLRGMCEDLIVLGGMRKMASADRQVLIAAISQQELGSRVELQRRFFSSFRPQQAVLNFKDAQSIIEGHEAAARGIWNKYGWPNLSKGAMPQVRQIAEKQGSERLAILYDYLYRLTSSGVHFSVQSLLRSGWGPNLKNFKFSTKSFHQYFLEYCSLYGAFMFCLYFEFFGAVLRPGARERAIIGKLREQVLFTPRWPEMVTFEEMNLEPPKEGRTLQMIVSALQAVSRRRLIAKGLDYQKENSSERRLTMQILRLLAEGMAEIEHKKARDRKPIVEKLTEH